MEVFPISCIFCRKKKIKCDKLYPCNKCKLKDIECQYPPTFRSIDVTKLIDQRNEVTGIPIGLDSQSTGNGGKRGSSLVSEGPDNENDYPDIRPSLKKRKSSTTTASLSPERLPEEDSIEKLRKENDILRAKLIDFKKRLRHARIEINEEERVSNELLEQESTRELNSIEGNKHLKYQGVQNENNINKSTNEKRYYGPSSDKFMITLAGNNEKLSELDDFINVKRQIRLKRDLPLLIDVYTKENIANQNNKKYKPPTRSKAKSAENINLIIQIIKKFFHLKVLYLNYMSPEPIIKFLEKYSSIKDWSNDDDLLLVLIILIVSIRSIPNDDPLFKKYNLTYEKVRPQLYKQYRNLKNGISNESTTTLKAYVLECEDLFYNDQIEKAWNILFRVVSSAYSLGLHVYDEKIVERLLSEESKESYTFIQHDSKTSLWFLINFISAAMCSVLGRPNPVTFTFQPLLRNYEIRLNYKIQLTELIKKSTNVLIESYKVTISYELINEIDLEFINEAIIYEKILDAARKVRSSGNWDKSKPSHILLPVDTQVQKSKKGGSIIEKKDRSIRSLSQLNISSMLNDCPLDISFTILRPCPNQDDEQPFCLLTGDVETRADLVMLYGNRAKFHQHFMVTYDSSLEACIDSSIKVLEHARHIMIELKAKFNTCNFHQLLPFFFSFLYQTFVVIYIIMHLGFSKLINHYSSIVTIKSRLVELFDLVGSKNWRPSSIRILHYINDMCENFLSRYSNNNGQEIIIPVDNHIMKTEKKGDDSLRKTSFSDTTRRSMEVPDNLGMSTQIPQLGGDLVFHTIPKTLNQATYPIPNSNNSNTVSNNNQGSIPAENHLPGSLSTMTLSNYNLDYYNGEPMFPIASDPLPNQGNHYQNNNTNNRYQQSQQQQQQQQSNQFTIDPLLGFDLDDPFFIQNPYNFNMSRVEDNTFDYMISPASGGDYSRMGSTSETDEVMRRPAPPSRNNTAELLGYIDKNSSRSISPKS